MSEFLEGIQPYTPAPVPSGCVTGDKVTMCCFVVFRSNPEHKQVLRELHPYTTDYEKEYAREHLALLKKMYLQVRIQLVELAVPLVWEEEK